MIARFRDREVLQQVAMTGTAGALIGACWVLRLWFPNPTAETIVALLATALCGGSIVVRAARGLLSRQVNVDELVSIAIVASLTIGEYLTAATVGFIMVLGSLLESCTSARARSAIESLVSLVPDTARIIENGQERTVPLSEVCVGQRVLVKPGEKIAVDGVVTDGAAGVDQSAVTGEPIPRDVGAGANVFAGTFVHGGALTLRATRVGNDSTLGKIVSLIREAETHQAPIVRSADAFAKWFTPGILALAAVVWLVSGDFMRCVSVLVVGCPCALILATPTAIVAAMGTAARHGIMIKGGRFLEAAAEVDTVAVDKTGTLTLGHPVVQRVEAFDGATADEVLTWAAAVERKSEHPFGEAIIREAERRGLPNLPVGTFASSTGAGVSGQVNGACVRVGRNSHVQATMPGWSSPEDGTVLWVARDARCVGAVVLDDSLRPAARSAIDQLKSMEIEAHLFSGDRAVVVERVAGAVGIASYRGELLPHEKVAEIEALCRKGSRVMYVGDGVNDGPALASSHVGVALGASASPLALETAPIAILTAELLQVPTLLRLARISKRRILENLLVFGVVYNALAVVLASVGILSPIMGAIVHNVGSVAVVLNSARLARWRDHAIRPDRLGRLG